MSKIQLPAINLQLGKFIRVLGQMICARWILCILLILMFNLINLFNVFCDYVNKPFIVKFNYVSVSFMHHMTLYFFMLVLKRA